MRFVFPVPSFLRGKLLAACRLYAYPTVPELPAPADGFILLDSGAFALSKTGGTMDAGYLENLAAHYEQYRGENVYCIAPDVYLNPTASLQNWERWHAQGYPPVVPVLQNTRKGDYDAKSLFSQAYFYQDFNPKFLCFSNPGMRCLEKTGLLRTLMIKLRAITGATHVHNLGAGWDMMDIIAWHQSGIFESIDSISYYNTVTPEAAYRNHRNIERRIHHHAQH